jgi:hypothetical protein
VTATVIIIILNRAHCCAVAGVIFLNEPRAEQQAAFRVLHAHHPQRPLSSEGHGRYRRSHGLEIHIHSLRGVQLRNQGNVANPFLSFQHQLSARLHSLRQFDAANAGARAVDRQRRIIGLRADNNETDAALKASFLGLTYLCLTFCLKGNKPSSSSIPRAQVEFHRQTSRTTLNWNSSDPQHNNQPISS